MATKTTTVLKRTKEFVSRERIARLMFEAEQRESEIARLEATLSVAQSDAKQYQHGTDSMRAQKDAALRGWDAEARKVEELLRAVIRIERWAAGLVAEVGELRVMMGRPVVKKAEF